METLIFEGKILKIGLVQVLSKISKKAYHSMVSPIKYVKIAGDKLPNSKYIKVKNIISGICGSDMTFYTCKQGPSTAFLPVPGSEITYLGHETIGEVVEIGDDVKNFKVGDRVTMNKYMACCDLKGIETPCENCQQGNYADCQNYGEPTHIKQMVGAGFGDYYYAPEGQLLKVPNNITDDQAVLIEPFAVSLHSVLKTQIKPNDKVLVVGAGMIGLGIIQFIKVVQPNCTVYVLEKNPNKHEFAKKLGADYILTGDPYVEIAKVTGAKLYGKGKNRMMLGGFDVIFDSVGKGTLLTDTTRWLKAQGTLVKAGYQMTKTKFDETPIWWQGLHIIGVDSHGMENFEGRKINTFDLVIEMLQQGKLITDGFITHKYNLKDYKKAFKHLIERPSDTIKVVLDCQNSIQKP